MTSKKKTPDTDRNFDDLAYKFSKKVYGNLKGKIRLAVLKKDFQEFYPQVINENRESDIKILDAGSGNGPFSLYLAELGHQVTLCDHSEKMLSLAREKIEENECIQNVRLIHSRIQDLSESHDCDYDLVLCHAVIEWVKDPKALLVHLLRILKPKGLLSLTFYNLNGMIYKNLLRTNYKKIIKKAYTGWPGSLTPTHPLTGDQVLNWISEHPLELLCHSGMRVFHDYILNLEDKDRHPDTVVKLELEFSRKMPFRDLGRYQHLLLKRI